MRNFYFKYVKQNDLSLKIKKNSSIETLKSKLSNLKFKSEDNHLSIHIGKQKVIINRILFKK